MTGGAWTPAWRWPVWRRACGNWCGGTVEVAFFGGEPLLQWPLIKEIITHCEEQLKPAHSDKQIHYHLTSNLTLRPADLTQWVARHKISVLCGIDGPPEIHDRCRSYRGGGASHAQVRGNHPATGRGRLPRHAAGDDHLRQPGLPGRSGRASHPAGGIVFVVCPRAPGELRRGILSRGNLAPSGEDHRRRAGTGPQRPRGQGRHVPVQ